jgi:predicted MFS family arabinose efflux permease
VRGVPSERRGVAMGMYTMFLDVALGFGSPGLGLIAGWTSVRAAFAVSAIVALCTLLVVLRVLSIQTAARGRSLSPASR